MSLGATGMSRKTYKSTCARLKDRTTSRHRSLIHKQQSILSTHFNFSLPKQTNSQSPNMQFFQVIFALAIATFVVAAPAPDAQLVSSQIALRIFLSIDTNRVSVRRRTSVQVTPRYLRRLHRMLLQTMRCRCLPLDSGWQVSQPEITLSFSSTR